MRTVAQLSDLSGRKAILTGGAGKIGQAVGEALVELGARVAILDQDEKACAKRAQDLSKIRRKGAFGVACDLMSEGSTRKAVRQSISEMKGCDILIHCAALVGTVKLKGWVVPFEQQTVDAWEKALRITLTSAFVLVHEAREALAASGKGSVIFFGSTYGFLGPDLRLYEGTKMGNPAGHGAAKGGILQLTRYLATVLAPRVRVNAVSPGGVERGQPKVFQDRYAARTPLQRMAVEEDFKGAIAYLASDLSAYVTGHHLIVDGGWSAW